MSNRGLIVLVLLGMLSLGAGWHFGPGSVPASVPGAASGSLMFPGLAGRLAQARRIEIVHQGKTLAIERSGDGPDAAWGLADRDLYPVQSRVLREFLTGLTELRLVEKRTADPAGFARLGVENPDMPDGTSNLLRVLDADGNSLAALVLGHRRVRTQGNVPETIYVRRPDQAQAWLAEGRLTVSADPQSLIDRDIINLAPARIAGVTVTRGTEHLEFARDGDSLALTVPAEHPPLEPYRLEDIGSALDNLTLLDVRRAHEPPAENPGSQPPLGEAVFTAIDGLAVHVTLFRDGKDLWARFAATGPDVRALAAKLNGWEFQIGVWKEKALLPTLEDLTAAPAGNAAPPSDKP